MILIPPFLKSSITEATFKVWYQYALMGLTIVSSWTKTKFDDNIVDWLGTDDGYNEVLLFLEQQGIVTPTVTPLPPSVIVGLADGTIHAQLHKLIATKAAA